MGVKSHTSEPPCIVPLVSKSAFVATLNFADRPAASGISSWVIVPSSFGKQTPEPPAPEPLPPASDPLPPVPPPPFDVAPEPPDPGSPDEVLVASGSHVPSALQMPDTQSAPTLQCALSELAHDARSAGKLAT